VYMPLGVSGFGVLVLREPLALRLTKSSGVEIKASCCTSDRNQRSNLLSVQTLR
jgi:hypothetical protein